MTQDELKQLLEEKFKEVMPDADLSENSAIQQGIITPIVDRIGVSPLETDISTLIQQRLRQNFPSIGTDTGDPMKSILADPFAVILEPFRTELTSLKRAESVANYQSMTIEEMDARGENLFLPRANGSYSIGTARALYKTPTADSFSPGDRFVDSNGNEYTPIYTQSIMPDTMLLNEYEGLYYFDVRLRSQTTGSEFNIDAGEMSSVDDHPSVVRVTNLYRFSGGSSTETNEQYYNRLAASGTERGLSTPRGIIARIRDEYKGAVERVNVVGNGDEGMNRDIIRGGVLGYPLAYGFSWVVGNYCFLLAYWTNRGDAGYALEDGDTVTAYYHPWLYPGVATRNQTLTVEEVIYDSGESDVATLFVFRTTEDFSYGQAEIISDFSNFVLVPMLLTKPRVLWLSDDPTPQTFEEDIHIGGHHDVWVRPASYVDEAVVHTNITGKVAIGNGVELQTFADSNRVTTSEDLPEVRFGDVLYITEGYSFGTYRILEVAEEDDGAGGTVTALYLAESLTSDETLVEFRVFRSVSTDLTSGKNLVYPVRASDAVVCSTVVRSPIVLLSVDLKAYNVQVGMRLEILSGKCAGVYTIAAFDGNNGRRPILSSVMVATDTSTFQVYVQEVPYNLPFIETRSVEVLNNGASTGITVPYRHPIDCRVQSMSGAEHKARGQLGLLLPNLTAFIDPTEDHRCKPCGWPSNWAFPPPADGDWSDPSYGGTVYGPPPPNWWVGAWDLSVPTPTDTWDGVARPVDFPEQCNWPPNFNPRGNIFVEFERGRECPFGDPVDPADWGLFDIEAGDVVVDDAWSPLWQWAGHGSINFASCHGTGCLECDGYVYCLRFDDGRQFEVCLPYSAFDGIANVFVGLPEVPYNELSKWYNNCLGPGVTPPWYEDPATLNPPPVHPYHPYQQAGIEWPDLEFLNPCLNLPDIPIPALCYADPGDVLTVETGNNKGGYQIRKVHAYPLNLGYTYPASGDEYEYEYEYHGEYADPTNPGCQIMNKELILWIGLVELQCQFNNAEINNLVDTLYNQDWYLLGFDLSKAEDRFHVLNWLNFLKQFEGPQERYYVANALEAGAPCIALLSGSPWTPTDGNFDEGNVLLRPETSTPARFDTSNVADASMFKMPLNNDDLIYGRYYRYGLFYSGLKGGVWRIGMATSLLPNTGFVKQYKGSTSGGELFSLEAAGGRDADGARMPRARYDDGTGIVTLYYIGTNTTETNLCSIQTVDMVVWNTKTTIKNVTTLTGMSASAVLKTYDVLDVDKTYVGGTVERYFVLVVEDGGSYYLATLDSSGNEVDVFLLDYDPNFSVATMSMVYGQREVGYIPMWARFATEVLFSEVGSAHVSYFRSRVKTRFSFPEDWEINSFDLELYVPSTYTSVNITDNILYDPIQRVQDYLKLLPSTANDTAWDLIAFGATIADTMASWGVDDPNTWLATIFSQYSVGRPARGKIRMYFQEPTTISVVGSCGTEMFGQAKPTTFEGLVDGEQVTFLADAEAEPYDIMAGKQGPTAPSDLSRDLIVLDETNGIVRMTDTSMPTAFELGIDKGIDIFEIWHEEPINWYNGPYTRSMPWPVNAGECGLMTREGSAVVRIPSGVSPEFFKEMVGGLLAIESGPDAGVYEIQSWVDSKTVVLSSNMTSTTGPSSASGDVILYDIAGQPWLEGSFFTISHVGMWVDLFGTPNPAWDGPYEIVEFDAVNGRVRLDMSGDTFDDILAGHQPIGMASVYPEPSTTPSDLVSVATFRLYAAESTLYRITDMEKTLDRSANSTTLQRYGVSQSVTYVPAGVGMPYRIIRPYIQRISSTEMAEKRDRMFYYFDVDVISASGAEIYNSSSGAKTMADRDTYQSDGYEYEVHNNNLTFSTDEATNMVMSARILPVGEVDLPDNYIDMVGGTVRLNYTWSQIAASVGSFLSSDMERDVDSNVLTRTFMPHTIGIYVEYTGGPAASVVVSAVKDVLEKADPDVGISASDIENALYGLGVKYLKHQNYLLWSILEDLDRIRVGYVENDLLLDSDADYFNGSVRMTTYIPGYDTSGLSESEYPDRVLIIARKTG